MILNKPRTAGQWLLLITPTLLIIASAALGFVAERALPRGGYTALLTALIGIVPALIIAISTGCWLLRVGARDDFGRAVQGGLLGVGILVANFILALPGLLIVGKLMR